jgi:hypothetical protein
MFGSLPNFGMPRCGCWRMTQKARPRAAKSAANIWPANASAGLPGGSIQTAPRTPFQIMMRIMYHCRTECWFKLPLGWCWPNYWQLIWILCLFDTLLSFGYCEVSIRVPFPTANNTMIILTSYHFSRSSTVSFLNILINKSQWCRWRNEGAWNLNLTW